jgi:hypothetical protein
MTSVICNWATAVADITAATIDAKTKLKGNFTRIRISLVTASKRNERGIRHLTSDLKHVNKMLSPPRKPPENFTKLTLLGVSFFGGLLETRLNVKVAKAKQRMENRQDSR